MQSHLEAALLGQPGDASGVEDDFQEDDDDFIDEVLFFSACVSLCTPLTCLLVRISLCMSFL